MSDARPGRVVHLPVTEVIACTLDGAGQTEQVEGWEALRAAHLRAREPVEGGVRLRLGPEAAGRARELAAREAACCGFLRIEVETGAETTVTITGPESAAETIAALAGEGALRKPSPSHTDGG